VEGFIRFFHRFPSVSTPGEAARFVSRQVSRGADYIKVLTSYTSLGRRGMTWPVSIPQPEALRRFMHVRVCYRRRDLGQITATGGQARHLPLATPSRSTAPRRPGMFPGRLLGQPLNSGGFHAHRISAETCDTPAFGSI